MQSGSSLKLEGHIATTKDSDYRQAFAFRPKILNKLNPLTKDVPLTPVTLTNFFWVKRPIRVLLEYSAPNPMLRPAQLPGRTDGSLTQQLRSS